MAKKIKKPDLSKIKSKLKGKVYVGDEMKKRELKIKELEKKVDSLKTKNDSLKAENDSLKQVIKIRLK